MSHGETILEDFEEGRRGHGGGGDGRLSQIEQGKNEALQEVDKTYDGMIDQSDKFFQDQIEASKDWSQTQQQNQQDQTDFAIEQVEQQKEQADQDYKREQAGAYTDWQKQSNQYGANAEQMAAQGLGQTGYTESSQVSMYNTYQNRVSRAKEAYGRAVQNYNNMITQARLQNNAALAEIAFRALQQQLELALNGFQYKNSLILDKFNQKNTIDNNYWGRYMDVLNQINQEKALAEQIREFNILNPQDDGSGADAGGGGGVGGGGSPKPKPNPNPGGDTLKSDPPLPGGSLLPQPPGKQPTMLDMINALNPAASANSTWKNNTVTQGKIPGGAK